MKALQQQVKDLTHAVSTHITFLSTDNDDRRTTTPGVASDGSIPTGHGLPGDILSVKNWYWHDSHRPGPPEALKRP